MTRGRILDPTERFSEILFGLIMVLTFTGTLSATGADREEVRTMLIGALGCNLAWGLVDAVMYVINAMASRGRGNVLLHRLRAEGDAKLGRRIVAGVLPERVAEVMDADDLEMLRSRLIELPEPPARASLTGDDMKGALAVFLLVFLSTFPVAIPFMVFSEARFALRISNAIALVMLFLLGHSLGRHAGGRPWRVGLGMLLLGVTLVAITIALGG